MDNCDQEFDEIRSAIILVETYIQKIASAQADDNDYYTTTEWKKEWIPKFKKEMQDAEEQIKIARLKYDKCTLGREK